jgi:glycolate oxidase
MLSGPQGLVAGLEGIVSQKYVSTHIFEKIKSSLDTFPYDLEREHLPYAIVMPGSKEEVREILLYANTIRVPVHVRGSGTSFTGASRYRTPGIILSTRRLNTIDFHEDYGFVECGPGSICATLDESLKKRGFFLPAAPGSRLVATMGGIIANNTSAHIVDTSIGKPGDYVLGLEVVLPTGEIIETGTKGLRRPAGTDLTKLFVGGDGLLGVITKIRIRLVPEFKRACGFAIYRDLGSVARAVQRMYRERRPIPLFVEFMEEKAAQIGYELKDISLPTGAAVLFVSIGDTEEEAARKAKQVLLSLRAEGPKEAEVVDDEAFWEKLWSAREVIGSFLMQQTGNQWSSAEVVSNLKDLGSCLEEAARFNEGLPILGQLPLYLFGHIGGLTMHPGVIIPKDWESEKKRKAIDEKFRREEELNLKYGTCGGEWGQFARRSQFFVRRYGAKSYDLVRGMKGVFDPNNILNPDVIDTVG